MSKKQWKNVTENLTLQFSTKPNWSQEEIDTPTIDVNAIRSNLPTKTSATRQISDLESIPPNGPFLLNFSNTPYDSTEQDFKNFFRAFCIIYKNDTKRGSGIIEFKDLTSLTTALQMHDKSFINRPIRLSIANKEDLARIQNINKPQNRFQQKTQSHTSPTEDSENWRVKKLQHDLPNQPKDKSTWREKQVSRPAIDEKVSVDNLDNWRKPKTNDSRIMMPSRTIESQDKDTKSLQFNRFSKTVDESSISQSESKDFDLSTKETKKLSIFGDAKPVDTFQKDREIEKKIESRKVTIDEPKIDNTALKSNIWSQKKPQNPTATLEWREKKPTVTNNNINRTKTVDNKKKEIKPEPVAENRETVTKAPEPVPAPIPKNIWEERKKTRNAALTNVQIEQNNNASSSSSRLEPVTVVTESPVEIIIPPQPVATVSSAAPAVSQPKQPVIISVNGPYIDPKSRASHHSISEINYNKSSPTAVPIINSKSNAYVDSENSSAVPCNTSVTNSTSTSFPPNNKANVPSPVAATMKSYGSQSSWSRGPPKGLIEKPEINQ